MRLSREWHWRIEQMLSLIRSGIAPDAALGILADTAHTAKARGELEALRNDVASDTASAVKELEFRKGPASLFLFALRRGKDTGNYAGPLEALATFSKTQAEIQGTIVNALMLPLLLTTFLLGLLYAFLVCLAPLVTFVAIYEDLGVRVSPLVKVWAFLSLHYGQIGVVFLLFLVVIWTLLIKVYLGKTAGRHMDWVRMHIPIFGRIYVSISRERFNNAVAFLIQNDVPLIDSFRLAAAATDNKAFEHAVATAMDHVAAHAPLLECLRDAGVFEEAFCWLAANAVTRGDAKGLLPLLLPKGDVAAQLARRWRPQFLEPAVSALAILFVVGLVLAIVASTFRLGGG